MCGIAGIYSSVTLESSPAANTLSVINMLRTLAHRGPDAEGIWNDPLGRCCLGHRRLSIIDTSDAGRQPMVNVEGNWVVSFNGELYNFVELRVFLEQAGMRFRGRTDTEVLIQSIALWGTEAFSRFDGMFALAAFNIESGELLLARDPFGEKPLYYMEVPTVGLVFASELRALEQLPGFDGEVTLDAMAELLMFQYIGAPRTIYKCVKKLPPGCWLLAKEGAPPRVGRYFEFMPGMSGFDGRPVHELVDELESILTRSIERRMISDVPLGAFLSGGVDSSTVCALIRRKLKLPLKTFSIGFKGFNKSEHHAAEIFAQHLDTEHYCQVLLPHTRDFLLGIGQILDEPNADSSCFPTYLLSKYAREQVTVAISGDGGDEMFAGYDRYFSMLEKEREYLQAKQHWQPGQTYYSYKILVMIEESIKQLFGGIPPNLNDHILGLRAEINNDGSPLFCKLRKTDVENYLPGAVLAKVDRMSMQHALEVRTPFLNTDLAHFAERLSLDSLYKPGRGKLILRELAYRYLPRNLVDAPKRGFGIPLSRWGKSELLKVLCELLDSEESRLGQYVGSWVIKNFIRQLRFSFSFPTYQVWALCMLESWLRHHPARLADNPFRLMDRRFSRWSFISKTIFKNG
jgi:asparagine synthase (glutamine-hydrolysing)